MRPTSLLACLTLAAAAVASMPGDARACGGCFHGPSMSGSVITDHRMIFRVSQTQTTLYDEIEYQGDPQSFAWVLPIHGQVQVGLSSDVVFAALESVTAASIRAPQLSCPPQPYCGCPEHDGFGAGGADAGASLSAGDDGSAAPPPVNVISQQTVGPYDTVQLQSTDPMALNDWLAANGFVIPSDIQPIIAAYVNEGFDFLALRLAPGQGVQAMRPVRVTTSGAGMQLPLRMVSAGTGATVGITLWVIGDGRYEPMNFKSFTIDPSELTWDWNASSSDYATIRQQKEQALGFAAWQTESAMELSPYQIETPIMQQSADQNYQPIPASDAGDGGAGETAQQVEQDDLSTLFPGTNQSSVRVTRMRADLARAALANDLALQASADQSEISNIYQVTKSVNAPACPPVQPCPATPPCPTDPGGAGGGGSSSKAASPGQESFGCAAAPSDKGGSAGGTELAVFGVIAAALLGMRKRKSR